jgi:hypothetical protein
MSLRYHWIGAIGAAALTAACGTAATKQDQMPPQRLSASQHQAVAQRHDREARAQESAFQERRRLEASGAGPSVECFDQQVPEPQSGGERLRVLRPCWTMETHPTADQRRAAAEHRRLAAHHRALAASLWRAESEACAGLGEDEISHSPFFHRDDILRVEPMREGDRVAGARVIFRKVRGLDTAWMRRAVACHQARAAAMGYPPESMSYCPLMAGPTRAAVVERGGEIAVTITASSDLDGAVVLGRAQELVAGRAPAEK